MPNLLINDPQMFEFLGSAESVKVFERYREELRSRITTDEGINLRAAFSIAAFILIERDINPSSENTLATAVSLLDYSLFIELSSNG